MTEREFAIDVVRTLQDAGFTALWAGGCVRDELLGLMPNDYDVATDARPEKVRNLFRRSIAVGAAFGVIEVIGPRSQERGGDHLTVEIATFRSDGSYSDGRRPDTVTFSTPEEDARRRDFTINGMFFDPIANRLRDYVGGQVDLEAKVLRAIGNPFDRFTEDKLRVLRAVRIASRFGLRVDPETLAAARQLASSIQIVSAERIADELRKLLTHPNRARGVTLLNEFGLIEPILPELMPSDAVWDHTIRLIEQLEPPKWPVEEPVSFALAFAVVLHSIDKSQVGKIADRLRLSTAEKIRTMWLIEKQQSLTDAPTQRLSQLKPLLVHPGIGELLAFHRAEALASRTSMKSVEFCLTMLRESAPDMLNPPPILTGEDLIAMGLRPGPDFKRILDAVRVAQLDEQVRTQDEARTLVASLRQEPGSATP